MTQQVKVALVGPDNWGGEHARIFSQRPDVRFVAMCGRTREKVDARAAEYGVRPYTDVDEMLRREKPDLVSVCLPNRGRFGATLDAMFEAFRAGKEPPVHASAGRRALELALASIESFKAGKRVTVGAESFRPSAAFPVTQPPPNP